MSQILMWTCQYCGKDTSNIDLDYLNGYDHLSCALEAEQALMKNRTTLITIPVELIADTPNDQELGAKVRRLYYENNS
jgi:hypothetical protein